MSFLLIQNTNNGSASFKRTHTYSSLSQLFRVDYLQGIREWSGGDGSKGRDKSKRGFACTDVGDKRLPTGEDYD